MPSFKPVAQKTGDFVKHKVFGVEQDVPDRVTRGESVVSTASTTETFVETDPSTLGYIRDVLPDRHEFAQYCRNLVPL